jgi:hypothetical protein
MIARKGMVDEAKSIIYKAGQRGIKLRLLGGVGVEVVCGKTFFDREIGDIDFIGWRKQASAIKRLLYELDYCPRERFNRVHGASRLIFDHPILRLRLDVFLDEFDMCHKFDFRDRIGLGEFTLPVSDLLATKLQIVEMNEKDFLDIMKLLVCKEVVEQDEPDKISLKRLAQLCGSDWGVYQTFLLSIDKTLKRTSALCTDFCQQARVRDGLKRIVDRLKNEPKSVRWRLRALIGKRKQWYQLPESEFDMNLPSVTTASSQGNGSLNYGKADERDEI